jgi:2,3-bisphosphoglycerate-dependent phosphoglycerate mutase
MQFYFIRHAQSVNNVLWERTGSSIERSEDPELTEVGRRQAECLARFLSRTDPTLRQALRPAQDRAQDTAAAVNDGDIHNVAGFGITHLYSSLMVRAVATGAIIAQALHLPLAAWEDLHEVGGIYWKDEETEERIGQAGRNRAYFEAHYPDLVLPDSLGEDGWWNRPFEEPEQRPLRAQRFWRGLLERHGRTDDRVAVVSHGGFYQYLMAAVLNLPGREGYWFALNNAAITRIDFHEERIGLVYLNRVDFLPKELVT